MKQSIQRLARCVATSFVHTVSRKLAHVGLSAAHNEYMAIHWAVRHIVWLREMLIEVGLAEIVEDPTVIFGDNRAANGLCEQNMVTQGNQFIRGIPA